MPRRDQRADPVNPKRQAAVPGADAPTAADEDVRKGDRLIMRDPRARCHYREIRRAAAIAQALPYMTIVVIAHHVLYAVARDFDVLIRLTQKARVGVDVLCLRRADDQHTR